MFDSRAFMAAEFEPRLEKVEVKDLQPFFGDAEAVWTVRSLTASEVAKTLKASERLETIDTMLKAISENESTISKLREAIGLTSETPADIKKRLEQLVIASVEPAIDLPVAVKLAEAAPTVFYILTNKILELTGLGMSIKKSTPSGETSTSEIAYP